MSDFTADQKQSVYDVIRKRRDVRAFKSDPIPDDTLARILSAAHQAGSVGFMQPWNFILVRESKIRRSIWEHVNAERLSAANDFSGEKREKYLSFKLEGILDAPVNICVTCDPTRQGPAVLGRSTIRETDVYSTCCAIQNLWLAARVEDIGVGWVSILRREFLQAALNLPSHVIPIAYLCLGYPVAFEDKPMLETQGWLPRLKLEDLVFEDAWERPAQDEFRGAIRRIDSATPDKV
jgi:5,6-dimethylbenzimidazole synthase